MFFSDEDDASNFALPSGSSKLASLFGGETGNPENDNHSLKYTAPKEPKKKKAGDVEDSKSGSSSTKVLSAVAVHVYKYSNGEAVSQGKLGAAILADTETSEYKVLLYRTKQQPVTQAKISSTFVFTLQKNNYATLYDDSRQTWSLNFDNTASLEQFAKQICVSKAAVSSKDGGLDTLVSQDLTYGEGGQLEQGDSVEMKYSATLFLDEKLTETVDVAATANTTRFKLGRGKVMKGFDEGVLGMRKAGKRLLIVPSSLGVTPEVKNKVAANSVVAYEVEVLRVKLNKEKESSPEESAEPSPAATAAPTAAEQQPAAEDKQVYKSDKAKLISRIAKMGQPMLPVSTPEHSEQATDQQEEHQTVEDDPSHMKPDIPTKPTTFQHHPTHQQPQQKVPPHSTPSPTVGPPPAHHHQPHPGGVGGGPQYFQQPMLPGMTQPGFGAVPGAASQVALFQPQMPMQYPPAPPQYSNMYGQPQQTYQPATVPGSGSGSTDLALAETRQTNTELRISINKVTEKIDRVFDKVESVHSHQMHSSSSSMPNMEANVLLHNITRIVQENERLKQELFDKNNRVESQNEKINELIQRNQKYIEQSNLMLEERSDTFKQTASSSQQKVLSLEQDKVKLTSELSASASQISSLQLEVTSLKKRELELKQQLDSLLVSDNDQKSELSQLRIQSTENGSQLEQLSSQLKEEKRRRKELETQHAALQEDFIELKNTSHGLEKALSDRKQKSHEEREKLEQELEEIKSGLEKEISSLKEKLKKERSIKDVQTAEQISKMEEELSRDWKEKSDRLLAAAQDRHKRALSEAQDENKQLEEKVVVLENKLSGLKSSRGEVDDQLEVVKDQLNDMKVWKDKYDNLRSQAGGMKEKYEGRIAVLESQVESVQDEKQKTVEKARQAHAQLQGQLAEARESLSSYESELDSQDKGSQRQLTQLRQQLKELQEQQKPEAATGGDKEQLNGQVKKIMSSVYQSIRGEFDENVEYAGSNIHQTVLNTIKTTTLQMLSGDGQVQSQDHEEEEEDSEDEASLSEAEDMIITSADVPAALAREPSPVQQDIRNESLAGQNDTSSPNVREDMAGDSDSDSCDFKDASDEIDPPSSTDVERQEIPDIKEDEPSSRTIQEEAAVQEDVLDQKDEESGLDDLVPSNSSQPMISSDGQESETAYAQDQNGMERNMVEVQNNDDSDSEAESKPQEDKEELESCDKSAELQPQEDRLITTPADALEEQVAESDSVKDTEVAEEGQEEDEDDGDLFTSAAVDAKPSSRQLPSVDSDNDEDLFKSLPLVKPSAKSKESKDLVEENAEDGALDVSDESGNVSVEVAESKTLEAVEDPLFGGTVVTANKSSVMSSKTVKSTSTSSVKKTVSNDKSLFGDVEDNDDDFNVDFTSKSSKNDKKSDKKKKLDDSDSDDLKEKPPPPPLFGDDDDDDDDLDWLSK